MNGPIFRACWAMLAAGTIFITTGSHANVAIPDCPALGDWALKLDTKNTWKPNQIGSRTEIPQLFVANETATLFKRPMIAWTEADAKAIREAVLACRQKTKDRAASGAYNAVQSALLNRVVNFTNALAQARPRIAAAGNTLKAQPASLPLLRFHTALGTATTANGYADAQRAAAALSGPASGAARDLVAAMRDLPQAEIVETIATPAAAAAQAMRADVVQGLIADTNKIPATAEGLTALGRMSQALPREYGDALGAEGLQTVQKGLAQRRDKVSEELAGMLVTQIGQSTEGPDAFADIDRRANEPLLPNLQKAHADSVRAAAGKRREAIADSLFKTTQARLAALPETDASLQLIDQELESYADWPASAAAFRPRFQDAARARRSVVLAAVNKAEAGAMRGRIYESENGRFKLEFVDRTRAFATRLGTTTAGTYTEEKDGRIVVTLDGRSWVLSRVGRRLVGGDELLTRVK